jgi:hypothetical protein
MEGVQMSNHLGDTNKKVSETPRMDASAHDDGAIWQTGCDIERELNAANERIKRMEEAGDAMASILNNTRKDWYTSDQCEVTAFNWREAKEDKL